MDLILVGFVKEAPVWILFCHIDIGRLLSNILGLLRCEGMFGEFWRIIKLVDTFISFESFQRVDTSRSLSITSRVNWILMLACLIALGHRMKIQILFSGWQFGVTPASFFMNFMLWCRLFFFNYGWLFANHHEAASLLSFNWFLRWLGCIIEPRWHLLIVFAFVLIVIWYITDNFAVLHRKIETTMNNLQGFP